MSIRFPSPRPRTLTSRRNAAKAARKSLRRYSDLLSVNASDSASEDDLHRARLNALLWAEATIQRALADETRDRLGDANATPRRIAGQDQAGRSSRLAAQVDETAEPSTAAPSTLSQRVDDEIYGDDEDGGA